MGGYRGELIDDVKKKFGYVIQAVDSIRQRKWSNWPPYDYDGGKL